LKILRQNQIQKLLLGKKQRIEIAIALFSESVLRILDERIDRFDTDGMGIMRKILVDVAQ
jgi:ABC-type Mn2+/Zn2+ transport system ATPase subunit